MHLSAYWIIKLRSCLSTVGCQRVTKMIIYDIYLRFFLVVYSDHHIKFILRFPLKKFINMEGQDEMIKI